MPLAELGDSYRSSRSSELERSRLLVAYKTSNVTTATIPTAVVIFLVSIFLTPYFRNCSL